MEFFKSQLGQDKYLSESFLNYKKGYFVEIGAHDGVYLSNTHFFEKHMEWNGICVEPSKKSSSLIKNRKNSIVINNCVSPQEFNNQIVRFRENVSMELSETMFQDLYEEPHYAKELEHEDGQYWDRLNKCISLNSLLDQNSAPSKIDYISIDTQGSEWLIIKDFPLDKWNVKAFSIANDVYQGGQKEENRNKTKFYLQQNGYKIQKEFSLEELDKGNWGKDFENKTIEDLYVKQDS